MDFDHNTLVAFSKSWGLLYIMGFFACVIAYVCWPSNRKGFDRAKTSILDRDDKPWK